MINVSGQLQIITIVTQIERESNRPGNWRIKWVAS